MRVPITRRKVMGSILGGTVGLTNVVSSTNRQRYQEQPPPVIVTTGKATAKGDDVTFFGRMDVPQDLNSPVEVGFRFADDNDEWHTTPTKQLSPVPSTRFSTTAEMPFPGWGFPYYAFARLPHSDTPTKEYRGDVKYIEVPSIVETVAIETISAEATGATTARVKGRVAAFGDAEEISVGASVDPTDQTVDGGIGTGWLVGTKTPADTPDFSVDFTDLQIGTTYRARANAEVPEGPASATVNGEARSITTHGERTTFTGIGQTATETFELSSGLSIFDISLSGSGHVAAWLLNGEGEQEELLANDIGDWSGRVALNTTSGEYLLTLETTESWTVQVLQPRYTAADIQSVPQTLAAFNSDFLGPSRFQGLTRVHFQGFEDNHYGVWLLNEHGERVEMLLNEIGPSEVSTAFGSQETGLIQVGTSGYWEISVM